MILIKDENDVNFCTSQDLHPPLICWSDDYIQVEIGINACSASLSSQDWECSRMFPDIHYFRNILRFSVWVVPIALTAYCR